MEPLLRSLFFQNSEFLNVNYFCKESSITDVWQSSKYTSGFDIISYEVSGPRKHSYNFSLNHPHVINEKRSKI